MALTIKLCEGDWKDIFEYQSDVAPVTGDVFSGILFKDGKQRYVKERLIVPSCPNIINLKLALSFP